MRRSAAAGMKGPTSLITRRRTGVPGWAASIMPISPPMEVPIQSTTSAPRWASSTALSARYWA